MMLTDRDLASVLGGQAAATPTPTASPTPTTSGKSSDDDAEWQEKWDEQMKRPASWTSCTGGFWHGCTEGDRYR